MHITFYVAEMPSRCRLPRSIGTFHDTALVLSFGLLMMTFLIAKNLLLGRSRNVYALRQSSSEIEKRLAVKIVDIEGIRKIYHSNSNNFILTTSSTTDGRKKYLLKFGRSNSISDELKGDACVERRLNTPNIALSSEKKSVGHEWILYEYIPGHLMSEKFSQIQSKEELDTFYELERRKEYYLSKLHSETETTIDYSGYIQSRGNKLFHQRLYGDRYKEFYEKNSNSLSSLFDRTIIINGKRLPLTVNQILTNIREKYENCDRDRVRAFIGHGDAHHGNIIINDDIWFIDNEYADLTTPLMEMAKPYYNDFLGILFFHEQKILDQYFKILNYEDNGRELNIQINIAERIEKYIEITKIKLNARKNSVNGETEDFLSMNDYLFLCHILTKNPNKYSRNTQRLFVPFAVLLSVFDPYNPESIYLFL